MVKLGTEEEVKVAILVGDEEVTAIFPPHGDGEFNEAIKKLATSRQKTNRRKTPRSRLGFAFSIRNAGASRM